MKTIHGKLTKSERHTIKKVCEGIGNEPDADIISTCVRAIAPFAKGQNYGVHCFTNGLTGVWDEKGIRHLFPVEVFNRAFQLS